MARRIACVYAHPDDEIYGVGGSLALHAGSDVQLTVVLATSGEAGRIADPSLADRETLGPVRELEDLASWKELGLEPDLRFLRHRDGGLAEVPSAELVGEVLAIFAETSPDVVVTFGPEGITGHADHIAIGAAATEAFRVARADGAPGTFARLLHGAIPEAGIERLNELLRERGLDPFDPTQPFMPVGVPDETIGVLVDCSNVYDRKLEALRRHKTQAELEDVPFDLWPNILSTEAFVVAWPTSGAGERVLGDLFEGLPA